MLDSSIITRTVISKNNAVLERVGIMLTRSHTIWLADGTISIPYHIKQLHGMLNATCSHSFVLGFS